MARIEAVMTPKPSERTYRFTVAEPPSGTGAARPPSRRRHASPGEGGDLCRRHLPDDLGGAALLDVGRLEGSGRVVPLVEDDRAAGPHVLDLPALGERRLALS